MTLIWRISCEVLLASTLAAQPTSASPPDPTVAEILGKVGDNYKAVSEYELFASITSRRATDSKSAGRMHVAVKLPDRYRLEGNIPGLNLGSGTPGNLLMVHDGSALWFYLPDSDEYGSFPAAALTSDAPGDLGDASPQAIDRFLMSPYRNAPSYARGSTLIRRDTVDFAGSKTGCYVVSIREAPEKPAATWWIDAARFVVLRVDDAESSVAFTAIKLSGPLPSDLFQFKAPSGAHRIGTTR